MANLLSNGKASIVFRARGNRLWVSRRNSPTGSFGKPTKVFPNMRSITNSFDVAMDQGSRLSTAVGQSTGTNDALTGIAGAIQTSKGFGSPQRISPISGLTYGTPSVVTNPKGDVYAAFSGESAGQGGVWVSSGTARGGKFTATANLRGLGGTIQINPPKVDIGITNSGTVYVAFELEDGSIASWRRASSGGWTQLPTIGLPVNGNTPDAFALDVPSSGPAVIAIAQNGFIFVRRLSATGTAWTDREQVGGPAYVFPSDIPVGQLGNVLAGLDVATNASGQTAVAWGTNGRGTFDAQILYHRIESGVAFSASDVPVTSAQLGYDAGNTFIQLARVSVDIDNARHAVAIFTSDGATQGESNPIDVSVLNGQTATTWSGTQDFSRFCDTSSGVGPSLSASGSRGATVAWGCDDSESNPESQFATGTVWTRSFR